MQIIKRIDQLKVGDTLTFNEKVKWIILNIKGRAKGIEITWQIDNVGNTTKFTALYDANSEWKIDEQDNNN